MSIDDLEVPAELVELRERVQDYLGAWENSDDNAATEVLYEALGDFLERYFQDQDVPLATAISALLHATSSVIGNAVDGNGQDGRQGQDNCDHALDGRTDVDQDWAVETGDCGMTKDELNDAIRECLAACRDTTDNERAEQIYEKLVGLVNDEVEHGGVHLPTMLLALINTLSVVIGAAVDQNAADDDDPEQTACVMHGAAALALSKPSREPRVTTMHQIERPG